MPKITTRGKAKKKGPYKKTEYEEFIRFTALPRFLRDDEFGFQSDDAFIHHHKLSSSTIYEWRKCDSFWDQVKKVRKQWGKDRTPDVITGLYRTAVKEGRAPEVRLWMELFEDFSSKSQASINLNRESLKAIQDSTRALLNQEKQEVFSVEDD